MTILEAMEARHSVRAYLNKSIPADIREKLDAYTDELNRDSGLHLRVIYDDPEGFDSRLAHYGSFRGVTNYIVLAGKKGQNFDYLCGFFGEKLVLFAQQLGLNTCWTALTFNKKRVRELIPAEETLCMAIALGYGESQGRQHRSKSYSEVADQTSPDWFRKGVEAALLAPTAVNQQKFFFSCKDGNAFARAKGLGSCLKVDLGIVCCHFELASGHPVQAE